MSCAPAPPNLLPVFTWLREPHSRRAAMVLIRQAIKGGWLIPDEDRDRIRRALVALQAERDLRPREAKKVAETLGLIEAAGLVASASCT